MVDIGKSSFQKPRREEILHLLSEVVLYYEDVFGVPFVIFSDRLPSFVEVFLWISCLLGRGLKFEHIVFSSFGHLFCNWIVDSLF